MNDINPYRLNISVSSLGYFLLFLTTKTKLLIGEIKLKLTAVGWGILKLKNNYCSLSSIKYENGWPSFKGIESVP